MPAQEQKDREANMPFGLWWKTYREDTRPCQSNALADGPDDVSLSIVSFFDFIIYISYFLIIKVFSSALCFKFNSVQFLTYCL